MPPSKEFPGPTPKVSKSWPAYLRMTGQLCAMGGARGHSGRSYKKWERSTKQGSEQGATRKDRGCMFGVRYP